MIDLAIRSDRVILPGGTREAVVLVANGKIAGVAREFPEGDYTRVDAGKKLLMPGIVDPHVHINEPGRTEWEGFDTATRSAVAGGVTTLIDMPLNSSPVTTTTAAFDEKIKATRGQLHTNCGFWGGVVPGNENEIEPLIEKGVRGFKAFLTPSGIDDFPASTEADLRKAMPLIARHGLPLLVHCELSDPVSPPETMNPRSYHDYLISRPRRWENEAIALVIRLCRDTGCPVHIVHLSSSGAIDMIRSAKKEGLPVTVETAQHYLYFDAEHIPDGKTAFKCAPPIRERDNNDKLWEALQEGVIDFVATDHSPAPPSVKEIASGDLTKAWGGIASIQFALPVLWTAAKKLGHSPDDIAKWLCENPARLPGLGSVKGKIQEGFDADLTIWDPDASFTVSEDMILHRHKITPYLGERLLGVVEKTWIGGKLVMDKGRLIANQGNLLTR